MKGRRAREGFGEGPRAGGTTAQRPVRLAKRTGLLGRRRGLSRLSRGGTAGAGLVSAEHLELDELPVDLERLLNRLLEVLVVTNGNARAGGHQESDRGRGVHLVLALDAGLQDLEARRAALQLDKTNLAVVVQACFELSRTLEVKPWLGALVQKPWLPEETTELPVEF